MLDVKTLKSAEEISGVDAVMRHLNDSGWLEVRDGGQTSVTETPDGVLVTKRSAVGVMRNVARTKGQITKLKQLAETRGFEWDDEKSPDRVVEYWASDERVDRHGDRVLQTWDDTDFNDNPVMLFSHEWERPSIGGVLEWAVDARKDAKYDGPALGLKALFADAETYPFADTVYRLTKAGFMPSGSVGFFAESALDVKDAKERHDLGLGPKGLVFAKNILVEWSPCSVPANPGAHQRLSIAKRAKLFLPGDVAVVREMARMSLLSRRDVKPEEEWERVDRALCSMLRSIFPECECEQSKDVHERIELEAAKAKPTSTPTANDGKDEEDYGKTLEDVTTRLGSLETMMSDVRDLLENMATKDLGAGESKDEDEPVGESNVDDALVSMLAD